MDFPDVIRRRKMVRTFDARSVDRRVVDRILDHGMRAPSAGFAQGLALLVLEGQDQTGRFWQAVAHHAEGEWPGEGLRRAPVLVIPFASKKVYLDRYAEDDKGWADRDEARWPVPYWMVDAAFASMSILLSSVNEGLGALFFGLDVDGYDRLRRAFGVPEEWSAIGVIALGHRAVSDPVASSRDTRSRRPSGQVVHRGHW